MVVAVHDRGLEAGRPAGLQPRHHVVDAGELAPGVGGELAAPALRLALVEALGAAEVAQAPGTRAVHFTALDPIISAITENPWLPPLPALG